MHFMNAIARRMCRTVIGSAASGREALEKLATLEVDVLLTDLRHGGDEWH
jgi:YesN/AraC family two-component response regulator